MTDPDGGVERPYSKDYWDNVIREVDRRPAVKLSAVLLVLLYATAIYAPLLANDRPLVLEGVDYGAYQTARRTLAPIASSLAALAEKGPAGHDRDQIDRLLPTVDAAVRGRIRGAVLDQAVPISRDQLDSFSEPWSRAVEASLRSGDFSDLRGVARDIAGEVGDAFAEAGVRTVRITDEAATQIAMLHDEHRTWDEVVALEVDAFEMRVATMRRHLAPVDAAPLEELSDEFERVAAQVKALDDGGDAAAALADAQALVDHARDVRSSLAAREPGDAADRGVPLVPSRSYPALSDLTRWEVYFMALWLLVMTWPAWNRVVNGLVLGGSRHRIRTARRAKILSLLLLPVLPALVWDVGQQSDLFISGFKSGLTDGSIVASTAVFPPIPYGRAEQNDSEVFRPPTWAEGSAITEKGFYATGPRAPREDMAEGTQPVAQPVKVNYAEASRNAPTRRILGTDSLGRDLLARMIWGGRISLSVGLVAAAFIVVLGTIIGSIAGYFGGRTDMVISRVIEIFQCFPVLFFALIIVAFVGPGIFNIMVVLGVLRWTTTARLARGEFIRLRGQDFVVASEALGVSHGRTIFRHVLPNALGPILVSFTFVVAFGILVESSLSFLGFGIQLPIPSWGSLLQESRSAEHWWIQVFTGFAIFLTILLYNLLGEGLRDALDPRQKAR